MDFWEIHSVWFLLGLTFFPRLTMLFAGTVSGFGFLGWVGWVIAPHLTVAILATTYYWDTNPWLCVAAWVVAIVGTGGETETAKRASK